MADKIQFTWDDFWKGKWPNLATFTGLIFICVVFPLLNYGGYYKLSLVAYVFGWILDGVDGKLARLLKVETTFGAFFDQASDKVCTLTVNLFYVYILNRIANISGNAMGFYIFVISIIFVGAVTLVSIRIYMMRNAKRLRQGKSIGAVDPGKIKTNIERAAGCILVLTQIYMYHVGIDEVSKYTIYFAIFTLAVSVYFAGMSIRKQVEKFQ